MNVDSENYHEVREYIKEHKLLEKVKKSDNLVRIH